MSIPGTPFNLDQTTAYLGRLGDPSARIAAAQALNEGIIYAAYFAREAAPDVSIDAVIAGIRSHFGLPAIASNSDDPFSIPLFASILQKSKYPEANLRGILAETARGVVADLSRGRSPRPSLLRSFLDLITR